MTAPSPQKPTAAIVYAALLAGTLDILAAVIMFMSATGKNPAIVFKYIASGVFGDKAYGAYPLMAFWGGLFHYLIALLFTIAYFLVYPRLKLLHKSVWISAALYGVFVWAVMNLLVVPLSKTAPMPFNAGKAVQAALVLIICIGLPIAIVANRYYKKLYRSR